MTPLKEIKNNIDKAFMELRNAIMPIMEYTPTKWSDMSDEDMSTFILTFAKLQSTGEGMATSGKAALHCLKLAEPRFTSLASKLVSEIKTETNDRE